MASKPLVVQEKIEDMIDYAEGRVQSFPPLFRNTLGKRLLDKCYEMSDLCEAANNDKYKQSKLKLLDEANHAAQRMVRRCNRTVFVDRNKHRRQLLELRRYLEWSDMLTEIGRLIGGWREWAAKQPAYPKARPPEQRQ